jgi:hypothetical protein
MKRESWYNIMLRHTNLIEGMEGIKNRMGGLLMNSYGGAIVYSKKKFIEAGMENEKFISHAPEDRERFYRFNELGYRVNRVDGCLYHMDHFMGENSRHQHKYEKQNKEEYEYILSLKGDKLKQYVSGWDWIEEYKKNYKM